VTILVLTTVLPWEQRSGGEIVSRSLIQAIAAAGRTVRVIGYRRPGDDGAPVDGEICAGHRPIETSAAGLLAPGWMMRALLTRAPYSVAKYDSRNYVAAVRDAVAEADVVVVDHAQVGFAVSRAVPADMPLVFVAHNAEGPMYATTATTARRRAARLMHRREARRIGAVEAELAARAAQVWTLTADDREYFRNVTGAPDVRALDVAARNVGRGGTDPTCDVALIGNWSWEANRAGLEWFCDEVVPLLAPERSVRIAGTGCDALRGRFPNVAVCGRVDDPDEFLADARVVAVPAVAGGGVQVKTLDAIAAGVPVVSTPLGVRGLGDVPHSVHVAGDGVDFAQAIEHVIGNGTQDADREQGLRWSVDRRDRFAAAVAAWLSEIVDEPPARDLAAVHGEGG
jgi:hypothetical protein